MDEMIFKKAAIETVDFECGEWRGLAGTIVNGLKNLPAANRWIPCRERLPELRKWVLCQCRAGIIDVLRLNEEGDWVKLYPNTIYMNGFVTAWMPLPEPYKEEEDGTVD